MEKPNEPLTWFYDAIDHAVSRTDDLTPDDEHEVYLNLSVMKSIRDHINEQAAYLESLESEVGRRRASIDDELRRRAVLNAQEGRAEPSATCNVPSYALATIKVDSIIGHQTILEAYNDESREIIDEFDGDVVEVHPVGTADKLDAQDKRIAELEQQVAGLTTDLAAAHEATKLAADIGIQIESERDAAASRIDELKAQLSVSADRENYDSDVEREPEFVIECNCGGQVLGTRQGGRLFTWCDSCTPIAGNATSLERITSVWPVLNRRRGELISEDIKGTLVARDRVELDRLTSFADWYVSQVAPRPTEVLDELEALLADDAAIATELEAEITACAEATLEDAKRLLREQAARIAELEAAHRAQVEITARLRTKLAERDERDIVLIDDLIAERDTALARVTVLEAENAELKATHVFLAARIAELLRIPE